MSQIIRKGVKSISKSGSAKLTDDVTLSEGSNITLTQTGNDIEIAASGGGGSGDVVGPGSAVNNRLVAFDGTTGKAIKEIPLEATYSGGIVSLIANDGLNIAMRLYATTLIFHSAYGGTMEFDDTGLRVFWVLTDEVKEKTSGQGVLIDGVLIKDGEVDGRDIAADGSKLDGIEAGADVTDATNVAAAGAVMESDTSTASMGFVIDEDDMASNSATKVPTQQSVKAYVDANAGGAGITWNEVTGTSQVAAVNNGYITNNAGLVTVTLPSTAAVGSVVRIVGKGAGGWKVAQNASDVIHFGNVDTTTGTGGSLASTNRYDAVELVCITANNDWVVLSSVGNITVV